MGFHASTVSAEGLRSVYRDQFPVAERLIYLNHAAVAPLSRRAAEAMKELADDACHFGSYHYDKWLDAYEGVRVATARMIGASPEEIAIVKNTSEGISTIALGIDWKAGDKIVAFREEFSANYFPWKRLEARGARVEWLSVFDPLDRIDQAAEGARLLAISFVQYLSGFRSDVETIGEICHRRGAIFLLDAIQGLGAYPLDVRKARIHALSADGHKWLLGPEGCGVLYVRRELQDSVQPAEFGWLNVARFADYSSRDMALRDSAARYECGTLNTIGCYGLRAAMELLLEIGVENVAAAVTALTDQFAEGAVRKGYEILAGRAAGSESGIVTVRKQGVDSRLLVRQLDDAGIVAAPRQGWVRVSPHFYVSPEEIARVLDLLP
jgi:selenocysteine lyase/cysteine desulfurase